MLATISVMLGHRTIILWDYLLQLSALRVQLSLLQVRGDEEGVEEGERGGEGGSE